MSFSSGTFSLVAGNPVVTGTTISSTVQNNTMNDVATGLTACLLKDGTQTATAAIGFAAGITIPTGQAATGSGSAAITGFAITAPTSVSGTVYSSTYTPTISATTNVAASTMRVTTYVRLASGVLVFGNMDIDPTAASATTWEIDLPVASNIGNPFEVGGTFVDATTYLSGFIRGEATNNTAQFSYTPTNTANQTINFIFGYRVI